MKKILTFLCLWVMLAGVAQLSAAVTSYVGLTFSRTGTDAESVTVDIVDSDGNAIEGVTAVLTSTSHSFMSTTGNVTSSILCPNVNGSTSPTITLVFTITGLDSSTRFNKVGLDIHALNSSGNYQSNSDSKSRQWNVDFANGTSTDDVATFGTLDDIDIAADIETGGLTHAVWEIEGDTQTADETLVLQLTITAGSSNVGCFFGLSEIQLSQIEDGPLGSAEAYFFRWYTNSAQYITEESDGSLVTATQDNTQRQFWGLESTGNENCFYIQNLASGNYIQSSNMSVSTKSLVTTGTDPVEFYIIQDTLEDDAVYGYYRFASTDCDNYDGTDGTPTGVGRTTSKANIIVWKAGASNTGAWWKIEETDYLYDLRAFDFSSAIGQADYAYVILSTSGLALTMDSEGNLTWETRNGSETQYWYFVGESNLTGSVIVNVGTGLSIDLSGEEATLWYALSSGDYYYFRPLDTKNEAGTALSVDGDSLVSFTAVPNAFSRASQIYNYPCGATSSSYIKHATIDGTGALKSLVYPLPKLSSSTVKTTTASKPSTWYSIYTDDKATLAIGQPSDLELVLTYDEGDELYIYYDWDRDGIFESSEQLEVGDTVTAQINVPETAEEGKTRIRLRLTANGLTDAEDDVAGETLDLVVYTSLDIPSTYEISVSVNDTTRGTAEVVSAQDGEAQVSASALGDAEFVCWQEDNVILSADEEYSFEYTRSMALVAYFSPNTEVEGISTVGLSEEKAIVSLSGDSHTITVNTDRDVRLVKVFSPEGQLVAQSTSKVVKSSALGSGVYIVKVYLADNDVAQKIRLN